MNSTTKIFILILLGILFASLTKTFFPIICAVIIVAAIIGNMSHANEKKEKESTQSSDNSNDQDDTENVYQSSQTNHNSTQWSEDEPIKAGGGKRARNRIFQANTLLQGGTIHNKSDKEKLYTSAISIIALFSWVMRKDEGEDDEE